MVLGRPCVAPSMQSMHPSLFELSFQPPGLLSQGDLCSLSSTQFLCMFGGSASRQVPWRRQAPLSMLRGTVTPQPLFPPSSMGLICVGLKGGWVEQKEDVCRHVGIALLEGQALW